MAHARVEEVRQEDRNEGEERDQVGALARGGDKCGAWSPEPARAQDSVSGREEEKSQSVQQ